MRILHLFRPALPGLRAQAIQVVHACHALAALGHEVTLLADRGEGPDPLSPFGLDPVPGLQLKVAPLRHKGGAGAWFRAQAALWWMGEPGTVLVRDAARFLALQAVLPRRHRVVYEAHGFDPALDWEALAPDALITNCGGTLARWQAHLGPRLFCPQLAVHNATNPDRRRDAAPSPSPVIRYVGSDRDYKGLDLLSHRDLPLPLELVHDAPFTAVPDLLADCRALVLPLADNEFGRHLTSPLKLWDYLATSVPIVAADLPTTREIASLSHVDFHWYSPGDPTSLAQAARAAVDAGPRGPFVRSWTQRARETLPLLTGSPA